MWKTLIKKELRLQSMSLAFAGCIVAVWAAMMAFPRAFYEGVSPALLQGMHLADLIEYIIVAPGMMIVAPMIFGIAVAVPERALGTLEWQLSLPVSRRRQWAVKCALACGLGVLAAGILYPLMSWLLTLRLEGVLGPINRTTVLGLNGSRDAAANSASAFARGRAMLGLLLPGLLGLWMAASAIYVSSVSRAWIAAFFLTVVPAVGIHFLPRLADPHRIVFARNLLFMSVPWLGVLRILVLALFVCAVAARNFRLAPFRWRNLLAQAAAAWLFVNLLDAAIIRYQYQLPLHRPEPVAGATALTPLAAFASGYPRRSADSPFANPAFAFAYAPAEVYPTISRLPGTDRLVMSLQPPRTGRLVMSLLGKWSEQPGLGVGGAIVEVDAGSGLIRQRQGMFGTLCGIEKGGSFYLVERYNRAPDHLPVAPMPNLGEWINRRLAGGEFRDPAPEEMQSASATHLFLPEGQPILVRPRGGGEFTKFPPWAGLDRLRPGGNLFVARTDRPDPAHHNHFEQFLLSRIDPGKLEFELLDSGYYPTYLSYCASADGRWYAQEGNTAGRNVEVRCDDASATWTLADKGDRIMLTCREALESSSAAMAACELGQRMGTLRVSPDGRWLAFGRAKPVTVAFPEGELETPMAATMAACLLDLSTGREILLADLPQPPPPDADVLQRWCAETVDMKNHPGQPVQWKLPGWSAHALNPRMAWSPDGTLAVLNQGRILVFRPDASDEGAAKIADIDVAAAAPHRFAFLDANRILLIGNFSLWRLDLDKALASAEH